MIVVSPSLQSPASTIAAPARILGVLRGFARYFGLPPRARSAFIRKVEQDVGIQASRLDVAHYQLDMPGLIVHAEDDTFVPVSESQLIHEAWFDSRLLRLEKGGHQRVLADPRVIEGVLGVLAGSSLQARQSA